MVVLDIVVDLGGAVGALEGGSGKNDLAKVSVNLCDLAAFKGRVRDLAEQIVSVFFDLVKFTCVFMTLRN